MKNKRYLIGVIAVLLGFLAVTQIRSFSSVDDIIARNNQSNIFEEIRIINEKNAGLRKEIGELEVTVDKLNNQSSALEVIEAEIEKYKLLNGKSPIFGEGLAINIQGAISSAWMVDLVNEFYNAGAYAVSINGIRIVNDTLGFDSLPQGQIWFQGQILSPPYVFNVIGDNESILDILELPGGIFDRLNTTFSDISIAAEKKDVVQMAASAIDEE
ncbi:DUF881 domain-containing protein [Candidatus Peregrinibacteria bacterium]|jgi:uncharacterized protein YlxW (UPF0749 family)|nr:DUF881 domain-containing protein [Candidatus Peregrinibacteria bacterium]MBT7736664.1 DUF881 domain-containing protein [Candidatus Peregrinibacteria bacterium]